MYNQPRFVKALGFILALILLTACAPAITATTTAAPPAVSAPPTSTLAVTSTPESWQAPENWWHEINVSAFSQSLFGAYVLPEEAGNKDYYYDYYSKMGVRLAAWNSVSWVPNWRDVYPTIIKDLHDRHLIVIGSESTYYIVQEGNIHADQLKEAQIVDPYGNPSVENACAPPLVCEFTVLSTAHPVTWNEVLSKVKTFIDAGVDGVQVDEMLIGTVFYPDFNPNTVSGFRQYLLDTYTPEELQAMGQPFGITDFPSLDYAALARQYLPAGYTSLSREEATWEVVSRIPFWNEYQRFLREKLYEYVAWLINEGKSYAMEKYGRDIPFGANIGNTTGQEFNGGINLLDFVDVEFSYQRYGYFPAGRASTAVHFVHAFDKPVSLVTGAGDTDWDIAQRGYQKSTNLFRIMIAEAYGTGAGFQVEEGVHDIKQDLAALAPYYRYPTDFPYLFEGMKPSKGNVGLLFLWEARDIWNYTDFRGLGYLLADSGYQYDVIFGAEEFTWWGVRNNVPAPDHPLVLDSLTPYPVVLIPQLDDVTPNHAAVLLDYARQGGKLVIFTTTDHIQNLTNHRGDEAAIKELLGYLNNGSAEVGNGRILTIKKLWGGEYASQPQPSMRQPLMDVLTSEGILPQVSMSPATYVSAFMHQDQDSLTVHFVNYDYDADTDGITPTAPLEVSVTLPQGFAPLQTAIYLFSPGEEMKKLEGRQAGGKLSFTLPAINIWSVVWIGNGDDQQAVIESAPTLVPLPTITPTP